MDSQEPDSSFAKDYELEEGDMVWVEYTHQRDEIPENPTGRRDIEPVKIMALPTKKEPRFYVQSQWRMIFFFVSSDQFMRYDPTQILKGTFNA